MITNEWRVKFRAGKYEVIETEVRCDRVVATFMFETDALACVEAHNVCVAPQPAADEWRDIASAPRDGTQVLLGTIGSTHRIIASYVKASGGWGAGFCRDGNRYNGFVFSYSHWRPLPAPPSANPATPQPAVGIVERLREQWADDYQGYLAYSGPRLGGEMTVKNKMEAADEILAALRSEAR